MSHYRTIQALGVPNVVHQGVIDMLGDLEMAYFLSHFMYWADKTDNPLGVYRSNDEFYQLFKWSPKKVKTITDKLVKLGLITKTEKRLEHKMYFLFNAARFDELYEAFLSESTENKGLLADGEKDDSPIVKSATPQSSKGRLGNSQNGDSLYIQRLHTKITAESSDTPIETKKFIKPTLEQVEQYFRKREHPSPVNEAEQWFDYYTANGWKVGRNPMKDWKATIRNWIRRDTNTGQNNANSTTGNSELNTTNHFDDLREQAKAKYGSPNPASDMRTIS